MLSATFLLAIQNASACSRVLWNNNGKAVVTGRTLDWEHSWEDYLIVYPRGLESDGGADKNAAKWTLKYGSVTASLIPFAKSFGFDLNDAAYDGMNKKAWPSTYWFWKGI